MATIEKYKQALIQAHNNGDTETANLFATKIKQLQQLQQQQYSDTKAEAKADDRSIMESIAGAGETALTIGSSMLAEPVAGLAGLAQAANPWAEEGASADAVKATREAMTYSPRSEAGQAYTQGVGEAMQPVGEFFQDLEQGAGDIGYDLTGSPLVGALASAVPAAIGEATGVRKAGKVGQAAARAEQDRVIEQSAEAASREQLFDELQIPTTRSRITQDAGDFTNERQLERNIDLPEAEFLRQRLADESAGFAAAAKRMADDMGLGEESGAILKDVLYARKTGEKAKVSEAYKELAQLSQGEGMPIVGNNLVNTLTTDSDLSGMVGRISSGDKKALNDIMVEFGLDTNPDSVTNWKASKTSDSGVLPEKIEVTPLNILNFEEMNKSLNNLIKADSDPALKGVIGKLKESLNKDVDELSNSLESMTPSEMGDVGKQALDSAKAAKRAIKAYKDFAGEFNNRNLITKLTSKKKGSFDQELLNASEVNKKIFSNTSDGAIEQIIPLVNGLIKQGDAGKKALGAMQSHVMLDLMNAATKGASRKLTDGVREWSGANFIKRLEQLGDDKLQVVFKNNPSALKQIYKLRDAGDLKTQFSQVARASGTGDDIFNRLGSTPVVGRLFSTVGGVKGWMAAQAIEGAQGAAKKRGMKKKLRKALDTSPVLRQNLSQFKNQFPELAASLAIGDLMTAETENND